MCANHKRVIRIPKTDYVQMETTLAYKAKVWQLETWYDETCELYYFSGSSQEELETFAKALKKVLKDYELQKIGNEGVQKKIVQNIIAQEKIREANRFVYTDKVAKHARCLSQRLFHWRQVDISAEHFAAHCDQIEAFKDQFNIKKMVHHKEQGVLKVQGMYPFVDNFVVQIEDMLTPLDEKVRKMKEWEVAQEEMKEAWKDKEIMEKAKESRGIKRKLELDELMERELMKMM